ERAIGAGLGLITHIYCAQSCFHRRNGPEKHFGVAEIGLLRDELAVELIPDGKHLTSVMVRLILKCKPLEKIVITTDATAAGLAPGVHKFQGRDMFVDEWVAYRPDRQLYAGSILTMIRAVQFMVEQVGVSLQDAIGMATAVPSQLIGVGHRKGMIESGYDADLVAFDETFRVHLTMCRGKVAYRA
ncbi:MAG TPA: N-acetylglucosamine-6-phosphate deacetylase, partial [Planctomycetaceae bacterium]|nr:N-acetylglucosamine-6-phosphate deacetylase [Planctomycetaceae bacterium]